MASLCAAWMSGSSVLSSSNDNTLDGFDGIALRGSPANFAKLIAKETEKWGTVIRGAGIRAN
jgi:hypothetical protein